MVISRSDGRGKIRLFDPEVSMGSTTIPFGVRGLQVVPSDPPGSNIMGGAHEVNTSCLKLRILEKMAFFKVPKP